MAEWLSAMSTAQQVFAYIALAGSFALVIQFALLVIGFGHGDSDTDGTDTSGLDHDSFDHDGFDHDGFDHDMDHDFDHDADHSLDHGHGHDAHSHDVHDHGHDDHDALHPFTVRGVIAFLAIFGWSGLILLKAGAPGILALILGSGLGVTAMVLMALAMRWMLRLQQSGNLDLRNALGREATVYLTVPGNRQGSGKVTLVMQERFVELSAVTDSLAALKSGERVFVSDIEDDVLVVEPFNEEK